MTETKHEVRATGSSNSTRGNRRTIFYGYCTCGAGTTNSANLASVLEKLRRHAAGDESGMVKS